MFKVKDIDVEITSNNIEKLINDIELVSLSKIKKSDIFIKIASDVSRKNRKFSCHLFAAGSGLIILMVTKDGLKIEDGLIVGPYSAGIDSLMKMSKKYECFAITRKIKDLSRFWDPRSGRLIFPSEYIEDW